MRNFFRVLIPMCLLLWCTWTHAQNLPVYNSYYVNPYLYNPAEAATDHMYVFINHRQQWMGIEGAPQLTTVNFNTLLNESRAGIGAKVSSYKRGILTSTDLLLTYAYTLVVSDKNALYFGLSGGLITNQVDSAGIDDPALAGYLNNNIQPSANFGLLYRSTSGLNFGVTMPQLFTPRFNSAASFESTKVGPLDNILATLYYRKRVEGKIVTRTVKGVRRRIRTNDAYAPLEFYAMYKYAKAGNSQFEVMAKLNASENFWLGAGYRQAYGFLANVGFSYGKFIMAYSYELGGQPQPGFSRGTHEIQIGLRLKEIKKYKHAQPVLRSTIKTTTESHAARFQTSAENPDNIAKDESASSKKYYVVIRAFGDFPGADAFKKKLVEQKYNANVFYYEKDKKYYVHVLETTKQSEASDEAKNLKNYTKLKDARVLIVTTTPK